MRFILLVMVLFTLNGCGSWSTTNVKKIERVENNTSEDSVVSASKETADATTMLITEEDISDKKYKVLGDIEVTVRKTTIFHKDPTPEMVEEKLKLKAVELGADAVILVRYGDVGVSLMSWGALNGKGRAITFVE